MNQSIIAHFTYNLANAAVRPWPFPHLYFENAFPDEFYSQLQDTMPQFQAFEQIAKVRKVVSEDETGMTGNTVWIMFCKPLAAIQSGDRVSDGIHTFIVDAVGEWGSHTECIMRKV